MALSCLDDVGSALLCYRPILSVCSGPHNLMGGTRDAPTNEYVGYQSEGMFSHTFSRRGEFPFHCSPHQAMNGLVRVLAPRAAGVATTQSRRSCAELRFPFRYGNRVCGHSSKGWSCAAGFNFSEAEQICTDSGARLCTAAELETDSARGTGCGFDTRLTWTSDSCSPSSTSTPVLASFDIASGRFSAPRLTGDTSARQRTGRLLQWGSSVRSSRPVCQLPSAARISNVEIAVRCCGDRVGLNGRYAVGGTNDDDRDVYDDDGISDGNQHPDDQRPTAPTAAPVTSRPTMNPTSSGPTSIPTRGPSSMSIERNGIDLVIRSFTSASAQGAVLIDDVNVLEMIRQQGETIRRLEERIANIE